jgi:hypothetical protein
MMITDLLAIRHHKNKQLSFQRRNKMELAFDIIQSQDLPIDTLPTFTFKKAGGTIGRSPNSDWYIADNKRQLSNVHVSISYENDQFFISDSSTNGTYLDGQEASLNNGELHPVSHGDILQVERHHYYANRLIHTDYCEPENEASIPAIVGQVKKGQLFPGFRHDIETKIAAWTLYCQLNGNRKANELTFESWFTEQLGELGITSLDEMALFDESDFVFNGIPEWEWDEFISKYPQQVLLPELALTVEYFPFSKRLVLHYKMGGRKGELKRWELPSWTGWKIQYKKASRVIDIK